jgi:hypothetical protein
VVSRTDGDAGLIQQGGQILGMNMAQGKGDQGGAAAAVAVGQFGVGGPG